MNFLKKLSAVLLLGAMAFGASVMVEHYTGEEVSVFEEKAEAQVFFANTRVSEVSYHHATVGTTAADAIAAANVVTRMLAWKICADGANANYVAFSTDADPDTDGVRLAAGECVDCPNCTPQTLKDLNVKGGAASQGYSIVQYRQQ